MAGEIMAIINFINGTIQTIDTLSSWWEEAFANPYEATFALIYKDTSALPKTDSELLSFYNNMIKRPGADNFRIKSVSKKYTIPIPPTLRWKTDKSNTPITVVEVIAGDPAVDPLCTWSGSGEPLEEKCIWGYPSFYLLHPNDVAEGLVSLMENHKQPKYIMVGVAKELTLSDEAILTSLMNTGFLEDVPEVEDGTTTGSSTKLITVALIAAGLLLFFMMD